MIQRHGCRAAQTRSVRSEEEAFEDENNTKNSKVDLTKHYI